MRRSHAATLQEHNARKGFLEPEVFHAVIAALPDDLKPLVEAAYLTGWRLRSELTTGGEKLDGLRQIQGLAKPTVVHSRSRIDTSLANFGPEGPGAHCAF